ncbi:hypothetical protein BU17DRAFT_30782, partial [Hysterangium stoloniferum]
EAARVELEEIEYMRNRKMLTLLIDGWEDILKQSLYGCVGAKVGQYPSVLSLTNMTGTWGTADNIMAAAQGAMKTMQLEDGRNFIAVTTDNPSVMQAFRSKCQEKYFWVLAFACFLHQMNTIIGEICAFPSMKQIIKQANRVVTFFNSSHYWGGQLKEEAKKCHVNRGLKKNCKTRFYVLSLQAQSVQSNRHSRTPLSHTCLRPDAQKKEKGLSPVAADVVETVLRDRDFWPCLNQLIRVIKPLVDAIGNVESR